MVAEPFSSRSPDEYTAQAPSVATLLRQVVDETLTLLRLEIAHARAEFAHSVARMGRGAGLIAVGGIASVFGLVMLLISAMLGLALVMPEWLAALCIGLFTVVIGVLLCRWGKTSVQLETLALPDTRASLRRDGALFKRGHDG
jgi:Putative Actinobacterial Holin-X, holin superfamily III